MHNAIFSGEGTIVGQFVMPNTIQSRIAGLCGHKSLYLMPDNDPKFDSGVPVSLEVSEESIDEFLAIMEDEIKETEEGSESENRQTRMSAPLSPPAYLTRAQVLQPILSLFGEPRYLEIGVHSGDTFFEVTAARKVAVDREFFFDIEAARAREPHSAFFEVESDAYFGELILPGEKFDVIYLDGLHTFEQTLRDFCNSLHYLSNDGVIVIDDVVPNSYAAALPNVRTSERLKGELNDPDQSWMGDVYRLVFFIDSFFQQYNFATVVENHGQLVVWREPRRGAALRHRRIEQVARAPFESIITERDAFRRTGYAEIIAMLRRDRTP
jgi:hypothetical protein